MSLPTIKHIHLPKIGDICCGKWVQAFDHKLSHCSVTFVYPGLKGDANGRLQRQLPSRLCLSHHGHLNAQWQVL